MKFERNPCIRLRDNYDTDDGRTDDRQISYFMSSADIVKQGYKREKVSCIHVYIGINASSACASCTYMHLQHVLTSSVNVS